MFFLHSEIFLSVMQNMKFQFQKNSVFLKEDIISTIYFH